MQALSFAVHIPLVCFGIAFPALVMFVEWLKDGKVSSRSIQPPSGPIASTVARPKRSGAAR